MKPQQNSTENKPIILFDGLCNFCNASVKFIIKYDKKKVFNFLALQTQEARMLLRDRKENFVNLKTIYLIDNNRVYKRSRAIFKIFQQLPYPWKILSIFSILPSNITDFFYKIIAANRYYWFGKLESPAKISSTEKK